MTKKILIADDSVTIQKVVQITFARQDAELICVDNGDDALAKAKALKPDIVLADVMMPGKDGYTLAKAIKSDPALAGVPVILLAGSYEPFDEGKAKASGADGHIIKPFESQALLKKVEELSIGAPKGVAAPAVAPPKAAAPPPPPPKAAPLPTLPHSGDSLEIEVAGEDSWDLSEEPAAPKAPPPPAPKPVPPPMAAKPAAPAPRPAPPPPPPSLEVEVEVAGEDSWDLSEEPAAPKAPPPPPPKPAPPPMAAKPAAPAPRPAPPPPPVEEEVSVAGGDGWDLSEEPAATPPPDRMIEVEEPTLEPVHAAAHSLETQMEVEVEAPGMGGSEDDVWDLAEEKPIELDTTPKVVAQGVKTMAPAGDAWDLSEEPPA
ncbi:MAG: response regulator, partial [Bdellovibrionota bacterium]